MEGSTLSTCYWLHLRRCQGRKAQDTSGVNDRGPDLDGVRDAFPGEVSDGHVGTLGMRKSWRSDKEDGGRGCWWQSRQRATGRGRALSAEVTRFFEELEGAGVAGVQKWAGSGSCDTGEEREVGLAAPWSSMKEDLSFYPESSGKPSYEQICIFQRPFGCHVEGVGGQLGGVSVMTWTRGVAREGGRCCRLFMRLGQPDEGEAEARMALFIRGCLALAGVGDTGQGDGFGSKPRGLWDIRVNSLKMGTPTIHL